MPATGRGAGSQSACSSRSVDGGPDPFITSDPGPIWASTRVCSDSTMSLQSTRLCGLCMPPVYLAVLGCLDPIQTPIGPCLCEWAHIARGIGRRCGQLLWHAADLLAAGVRRIGARVPFAAVWRTGTARQRVVAGTLQDVGAGAAEQRVVADIAAQRVVVGSPVDVVRAAARVDRVVASPARPCCLRAGRAPSRTRRARSRGGASSAP
jgi:hypothetical protein